MSPYHLWMDMIESKKDLQMVGRAVRERWPIPEAARGQIVAKLLEIVTSSDADPRDINQAARVLASIDKMNVDISQAVAALSFEELKDEMRNRLLIMQQEEPGKIE